MRDLYDCRKVKDIAEGKRDFEGKIIKTKSDSLSILNLIRGQD